jgi:3-deoxy-manno-octulosonate cytidylyltransferase (CMP-KDO synthetase)
MIAHVVRRAASAQTIERVIVATDDERIAAAAETAGAEAVMTGECASGSDRIAEAIGSRDDWTLAVNIQGDEPLLSGANIDTLVEGMWAVPEVPIGTLSRPLAPERANDPNAVKVVVSAGHRALYFSRSAIPYPRRHEHAASLWRLHLGIYAFRREALLRFVGLPPSPLEVAEGLEQLRALENDIDILVLEAPDDAIGVDTPEDLHRAEALIASARDGG